MAPTARTDTTVLALLADCRRWLSTAGADRRHAVLEQAIPVDLQWWDDSAATFGVPGGPLQREGVGVGRVALSRGQVFAAAADLSEPAVWRLLWLSMAWGTGSRRRQVHRRMRAAAADPDRCTEALRAAAELSRTDPEKAYALLYPGNRTLIPFLGPAFFTKFLYFAGSGAPAHPSLILDTRVTRAWVSEHAA
ncbi:8-oxoguanine DNA glycosylase OGG fold protein [Rhodococcus ruber]